MAKEERVKESRKKLLVTEVNDTTPVQELMELLTQKLESDYTASNSIRREGKQIVVPSFMTYGDAARALVDWEDSMEEEIQRKFEFQGHPSDLHLAFFNSLKKSFGNVMGSAHEVQSFFGSYKIPGQNITIQTDYNTRMAVPHGKIAIPGLPIKIETQLQEGDDKIDSILYVRLTLKAKYSALADRIEEGMADELKNHSIFLGKAIDSGWNFVNLSGFPVAKIVYAKDEKEQLNAHILRVIKSTDVARKKGVSIKRTILLHGRYGTGKTLTALLAAKVCIESGWTFMSVRPGDSISAAFQFAKKFQPCMIFFEDIDRVTNSDDDRNDSVNDILNTIDGILSKNSEVMTILTTNHTDRIERAMLRPGRIDAVVEMGRLDRESVLALITAYIGDQMIEPVDADRVFSAAQDYTPAFIVEACNRSVLYAMERTEGENNGAGITTEDVYNALVGLRSQYDLMVGKTDDIAEPSIEASITSVVKRAMDYRVEKVDKTLSVLREACPHL